MDWAAFWIAILGYIVGSFPTGVVLSKQKYGIDVREMGSGNIGATNVTRTFGWYAGAITFFADFIKGYLPLYSIRYFYPERTDWIPVLGISLVIGHCFSLFLRFRGGKGVATTLGCLAAVDVVAATIGAAAYAILLGATRISAIGSLVGISLATAYVLIREAPEAEEKLTLALMFIVFVRHRSNIARLWQDIRSIRSNKFKG